MYVIPAIKSMQTIITITAHAVITAIMAITAIKAITVRFITAMIAITTNIEKLKAYICCNHHSTSGYYITVIVATRANMAITYITGIIAIIIILVIMFIVSYCVL